MANLNTRKLRMGIALPRWTEDRFNGESHKTINDWIPAVPRVPIDAQWHTRLDAYLADPTDASLTALEHDMEKLTSDHGYKDVRYNISGVFLAKAQGVLLASHMFRMAVLGRPGWYEMGLPPMARATKKLPVHGLPQNPFRTIGSSFQENFCYNNYECVPGQYLSLPDIAKAEFAENTGSLLGQMDIKGDFWHQANHALTHSWWTLATLFDPAMTAGGGIEAGRAATCARRQFQPGECEQHRFLFNPGRREGTLGTISSGAKLHARHVDAHAGRPGEGRYGHG